MGRIALCELVEDERINNEIGQVIDTDTEESEATAIMEVAEAGTVAEQQFNDVERGLDITEALESICEILKASGPVVTATESRLVNVAAELALSGTGIPATNFMPSLESMELNTALENVQAKSSGLLAKIGSSIKNVFKSIKEFLSKIIFYFRSLEGKVKKSREYLNRLKAQGLTELEQFDSKFRNVLICEGKPVNNIQDLVKQFNVTMGITKDLMDAGLECAKITEDNGNVFGTLSDLASVERTGTLYFKDADTYTKDIIKQLKMKKDRSFNGMEVFKNSTPILGNVEYFVDRPDAKKYNFDDYADMKRCGHMFRVYIETQNAPAKERTVFERVKLNDLFKIVEAAEDTISTVNKRLRDIYRVFNSAEAQIEQITTAQPVFGLVLSVMFSYRMMMTNARMMQGTFYIMNYIGYNVINGGIWFVRDAAKAKGWK